MWFCNGSGTLCRPKKNEQLQIVLNVVEMVPLVGGDEKKIAGRYGNILLACGETCPAGDDVVNLIFGVGLLCVDGARRKAINTGAEIGRADELEIRGTVGPKIGKVVEMHA